MQQPSGDSSSDAMARLGCRLPRIPGRKKCKKPVRYDMDVSSCWKSRYKQNQYTMINGVHFVFLALRRRRLLVPVGTLTLDIQV